MHDPPFDRPMLSSTAELYSTLDYICVFWLEFKTWKVKDHFMCQETLKYRVSDSFIEALRSKLICSLYSMHRVISKAA